MSESLDTTQIRNWRSIITLIVFVITNILVLWPQRIPIHPALWNLGWDALATCRVLPPRAKSNPRKPMTDATRSGQDGGAAEPGKGHYFPINFITAPLIADLFLLAILAIGRQEVHDGTVGSDHIAPIDIMAFFITLAYIAISLDASGLIRWAAFKVLQKAGHKGKLLYFYLYVFFFLLACAVGNDPVILSGTAFLAYMIRVSDNIEKPRAWLFTQFSVANIGSAILVSSNPTNLVLAGAFSIKFVDYTVNMIVPVMVTAVVLYPILQWIVYADPALIPSKIVLRELPESMRDWKAVNPNIPHAEHARGIIEKDMAEKERAELLMIEAIKNPFLDTWGAAFAAVIMAVTLVTILVLNAVTDTSRERPVFWVTTPAAFVLFCWDLTMGWLNREKTRAIAAEGRKNEAVREQQILEDKTSGAAAPSGVERSSSEKNEITPIPAAAHEHHAGRATPHDLVSDTEADEKVSARARAEPFVARESTPTTLWSLWEDLYRWLQETFPTVTAVVSMLPFALVPFALSMFVLVQGLSTKGWIAVFAYGWDHWVSKTGTVGAVGGMAFLSCILCNFAGTNIGTTILLARVVQAWVSIHSANGTSISQRTFWATVYSMALGVNYGAFSAAFSAALAGMLWRDILERKYIVVKSAEFARHNLPIISVAMAVGCAVLVGEVYVSRGTEAYVGS
ncbi:putative arsenite efflux transporter ArsB-like [Teratosphaeria destructans]|uniref:Arsenite efflux transporter ArsB-like n=1 Tax=Teratosphaeria destructans TaxID=418781 RepID=A0A9W7SZF5_9PEZI|nr:putative arsenite efflux transporter ArsB-like [Teratosphaeria destructans]